MHKKFLLEIFKRRDYSEDLDIDERMILTRILRKKFWRMWIGFMWPRIGTGGGIL
jgi:hypothetical protein